jgi:hypothetical protein
MMLAFYAIVTASVEYRTSIEDDRTLAKRLRTGIRLVVTPLPFLPAVGFFYGILPLFVMLDLQQVIWSELFAFSVYPCSDSHRFAKAALAH